VAYDTFEESVDQGQPIELYLFENLEETFVYTSAQETITYVGRNYIPTPVKRTAPEIQSGQPDRRIVIEFPITNDFARRYVGTLPASPDHLTLYRYHSTDGGTPEVVLYFSGEVSNVAFTEDRAKVNVLSNGRVLGNLIPQQTCRNLCNFVLYDNRCGVNQASFTTATTVVGVSANGLEITLSGSGLSAKAAANFFKNGHMSRNFIENRMVLKTVDLGGDQVTFHILLPFQFISTGTAVDISAGCGHSLGICDSRFNNHERYGGFPFIPRKNPFQLKVTGGS
jgi:uncharacterized phage protein (TIGR02218 family)